jgi:hypothetical protein
MENKRLHQRYQIIEEVGKPTQYNLYKHGIPGILLDLSAGGMAIRSYSPVERGKKMKFTINIPGIATQELEGKVEWAKPEGAVWHVGISFTRIGKPDMDRINTIAADYNDCKKKLEFGTKNVCTEKCSYSPLCNNPAKINR